MQTTRKHRSLLVISGLIAVAIGSSILISPAQFHATHGIELGSDANLLSEVRAPGGALLMLGLLIGVGGVRPVYSIASTSIAAAVYIAGVFGVTAAGNGFLYVTGVAGTPYVEIVDPAGAMAAFFEANAHRFPEEAPAEAKPARTDEGDVALAIALAEAMRNGQKV